MVINFPISGIILYPESGKVDKDLPDYTSPHNEIKLHYAGTVE
jgi:hypothetical protein